ncbi:DUF2508 family protein [Lacticaseibacillus hulanensis]|uniref:DUF2508 family protein n=1 Tax=Lacticaseibacillus hulanensis TaxID=2493111 RepID=UPI000FDAEED2|nr:DUF2508 family protein [Lacticaseibacillus hulanensis]
MFGRKKTAGKEAVDAQLLNLIYTVREGIVRERSLANANVSGMTEREKANIARQEGLFDFLHRQARTRKVSAKQVEEFSVRFNLEKINKG